MRWPRIKSRVPAPAKPKIEYVWRWDRLIGQDAYAVDFYMYVWDDDHRRVEQTRHLSLEGGWRRVDPWEKREPTAVIPGPLWKAMRTQPAEELEKSAEFAVANGWLMKALVG